MGCARPLLQKIQTYFLFLLLLRLFLSEILSRRSRLSRTTNDRSQKVKIFRSKLPFISCLFSGKKIGTILSRRSRLSRTSRVPSRLSRPRWTDCDAGPEQTVKIFPFFLFQHEHRQKQVFSKGPATSSPDLHPKRSPWLNFRDRGVSIRATNAGQKQKLSWRGKLVNGGRTTESNNTQANKGSPLQILQAFLRSLRLPPQEKYFLPPFVARKTNPRGHENLAIWATLGVRRS